MVPILPANDFRSPGAQHAGLSLSTASSGVPSISRTGITSLAQANDLGPAQPPTSGVLPVRSITGQAGQADVACVPPPHRGEHLGSCLAAMGMLCRSADQPELSFSGKLNKQVNLRKHRTTKSTACQGRVFPVIVRRLVKLDLHHNR